MNGYDTTGIFINRLVKGLLINSAHHCRNQPTGQDAMVYLSLREAAERAGTSKSTILRAIQSGRMSASRNDTGGYDIDPAELFRVFPVDRKGGPAQRSDNDPAGQGGTTGETADATAATLKAQVTALDAQIATLKELVGEYKSQRDAWQAQAERLAIAHNQTEPKKTSSWWKRFAG